MKSEMKIAESVSEYIASFPKDVQASLKKLRAIIKKAAPKAKEGISYGMPSYKMNGSLVYFAAYKKHIGFYPTPSGVKAFAKDLKAFEMSKGTVRFPVDQPLPLGLVTKIVKFRVKEDAQKQKIKMLQKKKS